MDNLDTLFEKKQYQLIVDVTSSSNDPKERFMRLSCLVILGKDEEALKEIESHQTLLESKYPAKLMKLHFELLLKNKYFDEAKVALKHYQNLPYISQAVEEFLKDMPKRIDEEEHQKVKYFTIDEINEVLVSEKDNAQISEVLFSLNNYNLNTYIDSLKLFLLRQDVNPNLRTYGLILLVDNKYNNDISLLTRKGIISVNPTKITPPFSSTAFNEITRLVYAASERNVTLRDTALHLVNCYVMDVYPDDLDLASPEDMAQAFILIAKDYIQEKYFEKDEKLLFLKEKIKQIIESTPAIKM